MSTQTQDPRLGLCWTDPCATQGELFRIGVDIGLRDGPTTLRILARTLPDAAYRSAALAAITALHRRWGERVILVLDFVGDGPPGPGESLKLVQALVAADMLCRIVFIQKPWMPKRLVSSVLAILSVVDVALEIRKEAPT